jgi:hypothetical protein
MRISCQWSRHELRSVSLSFQTGRRIEKANNAASDAARRALRGVRSAHEGAEFKGETIQMNRIHAPNENIEPNALTTEPDLASQPLNVRTEPTISAH